MAESKPIAPGIRQLAGSDQIEYRWHDLSVALSLPVALQGKIHFYVHLSPSAYYFTDFADDGADDGADDERALCTFELDPQTPNDIRQSIQNIIQNIIMDPNNVGLIPENHEIAFTATVTQINNILSALSNIKVDPGAFSKPRPPTPSHHRDADLPPESAP